MNEPEDPHLSQRSTEIGNIQSILNNLGGFLQTAKFEPTDKGMEKCTAYNGLRSVVDPLLAAPDFPKEVSDAAASLY
jgi:hypothetical protein